MKNSVINYPKRFRLKTILLLPMLFLTLADSVAQDIDYARYIIHKISSPLMEGRGYVNYGAHRASEFIAAEMLDCGVKPFSDSYSQDFHFDVNTFPGSMFVKVDGRTLEAGIDYVVSASCPSVNQVYELLFPDEKIFEDSEKLMKLARKDLSLTLMVLDRSVLQGNALSLADSLIKHNFIEAGGFMILNNTGRPIWSIWQGKIQKKYPVIEVSAEALPRKPKNVAISIDAEYFKDYKVKNLLGFIPGKVFPDTFLVLTAHYDHLGRMGRDIYFPGANDNASGIAMMLNLARHFSDTANRPDYSLAFFALDGEEMGLKGSEFYASNPVFPLENIKLLINLDMVGTGNEGITVVNGEVFEKEFGLLKKINDEKDYLTKVAMRGESCNSDHCPFYKKGVPSVFIYSMYNNYREYHNLYDQPHLLPLTEYEDIFRLLRDFILTY